jgi:hypothetical protein
LRIPGYTDTHGERRFFGIFPEEVANSLAYQRGGCCACFRQNQGELVPAMTRCRIDRTAAIGNNLRQPAECATSHRVPELVVDPLQSVKVQQYKGELTSGSL